MEWNISKLQTLRQCHRKFFFAYEVARHEFTFPYRRKAFELSKMKTLKMWQGSIIDYIVTTVIMPEYKAGNQPNFEKIASDATELAKRQFNFSTNRYYHQNDISKSDVGADWLILDIHECNMSYQQKQVDDVYSRIQEIILAFPTYPSPEDGKTLHEYLSTSKYLRPDARQLKYEYGGVLIKPQIDLVRYLGKSIHVIDWKVSERDNVDYSRQLTLGGVVALHFAKNWYKKQEWTPVPGLADVKLIEINLMNGNVKEHPFTVTSTAKALDDVYSFCDEQEQLGQDKSWRELDIEDYRTTDKVETCAICKFKSLCKHMILNNLNYDEDKYAKLVQHNELAGAEV